MFRRDTDARNHRNAVVVAPGACAMKFEDVETGTMAFCRICLECNGEQVMARVGKVAYRLDLPDELSGIHPTFHVSHLRKCLADDVAYVPLNDIEVDERLNYIEQPVAIVDTKEKRLRNKMIRQVKAKTVRETELRIVRNRETKKIFKVLNFWTRRGTRRRFEDPSRYATDLKYLKSSGFLRGTRIFIWPSSRYATGEAVEWIDLLHQFHAEV
ncbi:hypothetical protein E3N88_07545 [Mikania micrantha]|uniref:Tf2-1-like SH3-like domain-containing protein n=1 Tax=Mikania micrantha TaxID=192012 RepID=A0A5N6PUQ9_9ASTR|nr:hypothetical protein E3N88_07545 [Mikania micrantha]